MQEKNQPDAQRRGRRAPGVEEAARCWYACGAAVEAGDPRTCTGPSWKKKESIPAEEKESSRLELLV